MNIHFKKALHAPDLSHNLISLSLLDERGYRGEFGNKCITIKDTAGNPFMKAVLRLDRLYKITLNPPTVIASSARSQKKPADMEIWHRRLGHVSINSINIINSKDLVDSLNITTNKVSGLCEDCILGKQMRQPFDEKVTPEKEVLERVPLDLWGPSQVQTVGGKTYLLTITDGGTLHREVFFLTDK